jgi:hypothetical protein
VVTDGPFKLACRACLGANQLQPGDVVTSMKGDSYQVLHVGPETIRVAVHSTDSDAVITDRPAILPVDRYVLEVVDGAGLTDMAFSIGGDNMYELTRFNIAPTDQYLDPPNTTEGETETLRKGKNIRKCVARKTRINSTFWASLPHYGAVYRRLYGQGPLQNQVGGGVQIRGLKKDDELNEGTALFSVECVTPETVTVRSRRTGAGNERKVIPWAIVDSIIDAVASGKITLDDLNYSKGEDAKAEKQKVAAATDINVFYLSDQGILRTLTKHQLEFRKRYSPSSPVSTVLIIDEINRADLSRVMGELVTVLEPVKRLGQPEEIKVRLPYSKGWFGVPFQLSVIGTMNTTDRSLAVLDFALRRRFDFVEVPPDPSLCPLSYGGINVQILLRRINERIEYLRSRDQCVGHAELMKHKLDAVKATFTAPTEQEKEAKALAWVIRNKVLPLLLEYFPEEWRLVHIVLGNSGLLERREPPDHLTKLLGDGEVASVDNVLRFKVDPRWDPYGAWDAQWFRDELCAKDTAVQVDVAPLPTSGGPSASTT